jgi:uncharacterized protein (DUF58 family)
MTMLRETGGAPDVRPVSEPEARMRSPRPAAVGSGAFRLTGSGIAALVTGLVACGLGWGLGYPEALALGITALAAVAFALAWTQPMPSVQARREIVPVRVARDEAAQGVVVLRNTGTRTLRGLRAEDRVGGVPVFPVELPPVAPGMEIRARYRLPTDRRGSVPVGPMLLVRGDPLGLARRVRDCGPVKELLVRPRTVALPVLPAGRTHHLEGPTSDTAEDGTLTFHSLREYVLGDDLRRVHWRSSARTGRLMVRRMVDVSLPATTVVLDTGENAYQSGMFETAVDIAASVAEAAARDNFPVRVLTGSGPLPVPEGREPGADHLLDRLSLVSADPRHSLTDALDILERLREGDTLIVVTGTRLVLPADRLGRLRGRFGRMIVVRAGAAEDESAPLGVPMLTLHDVEDLAPAWRREAMR